MRNKNYLKEMFDMQRTLQERLGYKLEDQYENQEYFNLMFIAIIEESVEIIRETKWKPWKKSMKWNHDSIREEIIDLWHFVINISIAAGLDEQSLYDAFRGKNAVNQSRQDHGY